MRYKHYRIIIIAVALLLAGILRIGLPWSYTFTDSGVRFSQADSYFSMRVVDDIRNGVDLAADPILGNISSGRYLTEYTVYGISWFADRGHPIKQTTDNVAAILPAICGLLAVLMVYPLTKHIFGRNSDFHALAATMLAAIMPGEFLSRTSLGFIDHHALEIVLFMASVLFFLYAISNTENITYPILSGIFAGLALLNWVGALIILALFAIYSIVSIILSNDMDDVGHLLFVDSMIFLLSGLFYLAFAEVSLYYLAYIGIGWMAIFLVTMLKLGLSAWEPYKIGIIVIAMAAAALIIDNLYFGIGNLAVSLLSFISSGQTTAISEAQSLLMYQGRFDLSQAWANYGILLYLFLLAVGSFIYLWRKNKNERYLFVIVWSILFLIFSLAQVRFAQYLAVNVAILSAAMIMSLYGDIKVEAKRKITYAVFGLIIIVSPLVNYGLLLAKPSAEYPNASWVSAVSWVRDNTPKPAKIVSWWDYGYLIDREGQREAISDGSGKGVNLAAQILTSTPEQSALLMRQNGIDYIIIDDAMVTNKYYAYAQSYDTKLSKFDTTVMKLFYGVDIGGFEQTFVSPQVTIYKVR